MRQRREFLDPDVVRVVKEQPGFGPLFVLVPGLGSEGDVFAPLAEALYDRGAGFIVLEPRGAGWRDPRHCEVVVAEAAAHVAASGHINHPEVIYVGHSAGAMTAMELALASPDSAVGVVMINGVLDDTSRLLRRPMHFGLRHPRRALDFIRLLAYLVGWMPEFTLKRLERPGHWMTSFFRPMIAHPRQLSAEALAGLVRYNRCKGAIRYLRANRHYDLVAQAARVTVPVLAICGDSDPLATSPDESEFLRSFGGPVSVTTMATGHCSQLEAPHQVADAMVRFGRAVAP